jgi:hypothetical protein
MARLPIVEILRVLDRSNCGECGAVTCVAFSAQVAQGARRLEECPRVPADVAARMEIASAERSAATDLFQGRLESLRGRMKDVDLEDAAARIGGSMSEDRLAIHCLGRVFELDREGRLTSQCHVIPWVHIPILDHVIDGSGAEPTGDWARFRELEGAEDWVRYFEHRCEAPMEALAGEHAGFFDDLLRIFAGREPSGALARHAPVADRSVVLRPLPRVPLLFSAWRADGDFDSKLTLLLDRTATANLSPGSIFLVARGLVEMFRRTLLRHAPYTA